MQSAMLMVVRCTLHCHCHHCHCQYQKCLYRIHLLVACEAIVIRFYSILQRVLCSKCWKSWAQCLCRALSKHLLTSVFHKGLSFMAVVHNPTYMSTLTLVAGDSSLLHPSFSDLIFYFFEVFFLSVGTFNTVDDSFNK